MEAARQSHVSLDDFLSDKQHRHQSNVRDLYAFTIHFARTESDYGNWDLWIWEDGKAGHAYPFQNVNDGFATVTVVSPSKSIHVIPRKGEWEQQDLTHTIEVPNGEHQADVLLVQGDGRIYYANEQVQKETPEQRRMIEFTYKRHDNDYEGWNLWTWGNGIAGGRVDFERISDHGAVAYIEADSKTEQIGFVIRRWDSWEVKDPYSADRHIKVGPEPYTKVMVENGVAEVKQIPGNTGPVFKKNSIFFTYRDYDLFQEGRMAQIESVILKIGGKAYSMEYIEEEERFVYDAAGLEEGVYPYSFLVTKAGLTEERTDPANHWNGRSTVVYKCPEVKINAGVYPQKVTYRENVVLEVDTYVSDPAVSIKGIYADLSEIGGSRRQQFDPELNRQAIAVKQSIPAGIKTLPVTVVDEFGNEHTGEASIEVAADAVTDSADFDWDEARIYFMLTDRFYNGDPDNDDPYGEQYDKLHPETYHGGDFRGIIDKLDYLSDLGINTIWITPIVENIHWNVRHGHGGYQYGYHGYWAQDFTKIDKHLGDLDTFKELLEKAHDLGIKIMVDVVLNHAGYGLKEDDRDDGIPNFPADADRERFDGMFRAGGTDTVKGELAGMPDFMTENAEIRDKLIEWQADWLERSKTDRGDTIDYFRVDTVRHVEDTTWKAFKARLTEVKPDFKLIGEYFGGSVDEDGGFLNSGEMDSILDFEFKHQADQFIYGNIDETEQYLESRNGKLNNTSQLGQFLSSHDEDGFLVCRADWDEGKMKLAAALQITAKGQPVIYYGEEIGQSGKNAGNMDAGEYSENRYDFDWSRVGNEMHSHYRKMLNIRKAHSLIFSKGTRAKVAGGSEEGFLVFKRCYRGEEVLVGLNLSEESRVAEVPVPGEQGEAFADLYGGKEYTTDEGSVVKVELPGRGNGGTVVLVKT
ncbi:alpha-amylase family glycosyl hydrolase [Bacillus marinisedimentorum]|uniref:alpha-amylase family glycosyl hydrolase n=1 Tax=Bacillus marinisedimentorum TaxID=1821260 RepID=UPI0007E1081C|nr:alpha-amylase family glycosyl hydrolase [Bacillus marinisedimentorum]